MTTSATRPHVGGFRPRVPHTTGFSVEVVDREGRPVGGYPVTAGFSYRTAPARRLQAVTDENGRAVFVDRHPDVPASVWIFAGGAPWGPYRGVEGRAIVLEA